jgi:hypothetical protein
MVSEIPFHDQLAHCFWTCGKVKHHGGEYMVEHNHSPHGSQEGNI